MAGEGRSFTVNGLRLAALEWPGAGLPVIALHGWLDNAASFTPLADHLVDCHLLALELPGHGHSDHLPQAAHYHLADNLYWLTAVADAMGWPRFVLLGHSMGAALACLAAAAMPQRVLGLTLLDGLGPIAMSPQAEVARLRLHFAAGTMPASRRPFSDCATAAVMRQRHSRFAITLEAASTLAERNLCVEGDGYSWRYDARLKEPSTHYYSEEQVLGLLAAIEAPSLLLSGEQGALLGWHGFDKRCAAVPGLLHQRLSGGHHLHMESPQLVATHLNRFYATLQG